MRCVWCDSAYTFTGGERMTIDAVMERVRAFGCPLVEVTGGEPLAQKAAYTLITRLCDAGYETLVETGGFFSTEEVDPRACVILDVKCPDSGEAERNVWSNLERLRADKDEIKFVVASRRDWEFASDVIRRYDLERRTRAVLLSPVWTTINLQEMADWVSASGLDVRMQLQMHKVIWGADAKGV